MNHDAIVTYLGLSLLFILLMYSVTRMSSCAEKTFIVGECQQFYHYHTEKAL